jgi:hypothetical protein
MSVVLLLSSLVLCLAEQRSTSIGAPVPAGVDFELRELTSGRALKVRSVDVKTLQRLTLIFDYLSDIELDDYESLQREVEDVWKDLRAVAEERNVESVFIVPETSDGTSVGFTLRRRDGQRWERRSGFAFPPQPRSLSGEP